MIQWEIEFKTTSNTINYYLKNTLQIKWVYFCYENQTGPPDYCFGPSASITPLSCSSVTDGCDAKAMDGTGGCSAVCAGVSWNTGRCLPPQTWEPRWRCSTWRTGQVLHCPETLHQSDHQAKVLAHPIHNQCIPVQFPSPHRICCIQAIVTTEFYEYPTHT